jgi:hypothetical protein
MYFVAECFSHVKVGVLIEGTDPTLVLVIGYIGIDQEGFRN